MEYMHVIEVARRNGISGYRVVKSYKNRPAMEKFVAHYGKPVWLLVHGSSSLPATLSTLGGYNASYWNSGAGWQLGFMPILPFHA